MKHTTGTSASSPLTTHHSPPLEGRKKVRIRLRRNLVFAEQRAGGRVYHVVKDPVSLAYFRLDDGQRFIAGLMDGTHTLGDIRKAYEKHFRPARLSLEELEVFASQLVNSGLAQNESPQAGRLLFERSAKHRGQARQAALLNFLFLKVPLLDPDRLLARLVPAVRFFFTVPCLLAGLGLVLAALGLVATHWNDFLGRLPDSREFLRLHTLLWLWVGVVLVKVLHELGHGLCCKAFGGDVPEMGVMVLLLFPCLYCNVSDSWRLPSKRQRLAVSAAGIYVELVVAALATFLWWATDPGSNLHTLSFGLMVVCGVNTVLLNGNPLMRFDGYYLLADALEVANLAEVSRRCLRAACLRWFGARVPVEPTPPAVRPGFLAGYAAASFVYRWVVTAGSFYLLYHFLEPYKLGSAALVLVVASLAAMLGWPAWCLARNLYRQGRFPDMKLFRVWVAAGAALAVALVVWAVPFPVRVRGLALVQVDPDQVHPVAVPESGGFLETVPVRDGQRVRAGEILAVLSNPRLEVRLRVNEADQELRRRQEGAQAARLTDPGAPEKLESAAVQQTRYELEALRQEHARLREQVDRLTLRAPSDGVVMGLQPPEARGKWLESGAELCHVGNPHALRAVLLVGPADRALLAPGSRAAVRVHGAGGRSWPGMVAVVAQADAKNIPPQLSGHAGGEVATRQDPVSGAEKPQHQHYLVAVRLQRVGPALHPGVLGRVKIEAGSQTLWWRFRRFLAGTFNWGL